MKKLISIIVLITFLPFFFRGADAADDEGKLMKIRITIDQTSVTAILNGTTTSKDFYEKLPLKLEMHPHQNREFYADLKLAENAAVQNHYNVGDIAYWVSGGAIVLFYDVGYTSNLIIMGKMTSGLEKLSEINGRFTALIEKIEY